MKSRVLVAGIGNVFCGDDAFGVEVVRRLALRPLGTDVRVVDFGIRGLDLAYALLEEYELVVFVDACVRGGAPGTIYLLEPEPEDLVTSLPPAVDMHGLVPHQALGMVAAMGVRLQAIRVVGCEPGLVPEDEDVAVGLSGPVAAALDEAVDLVASLVESRA